MLRNFLVVMKNDLDISYVFQDAYIESSENNIYFKDDNDLIIGVVSKGEVYVIREMKVFRYGE